MASNNTDWVFGESRSNHDLIMPALIKSGETGIKPGDLVKLSAGMTEGNPMTVEALDGTDAVQPIGCVTHTPVNGVNAKGGDTVSIMLRGFTRLRDTANAAIPLGATISQKNGRLTPAGSTASDSPAIGRNIGGALANGDTGLVYIDCLGGTE